MVLEEALDNAFKGCCTGRMRTLSTPMMRWAIVFWPRNQHSVGGASWNAIAAKMLHAVVTNNFIASRQDGYFEFGQVDGALVVDTFTE
jgi:hypothetical protein